MLRNDVENAVNIFIEMSEAKKNKVPMVPRSKNDKEYFAQDWFADRVRHLGLAHYQQGRNSYPDFIVGDPAVEGGYEIKSLKFTNRPARSDLDFNSTIPSGFKEGREQFLVFFLYTGAGDNPRDVHTVTLAHGDYINSDHGVADEHLNVSVKDFGSFNDGYIRNRKMYVFPHPVALDESNLGKSRLIVPTEWNINDGRLRRIKQVSRTVSKNSVDSYTIKLRGREEASVTMAQNQNAGITKNFDVFEMI